MAWKGREGDWKEGKGEGLGGRVGRGDWKEGKRGWTEGKGP